MHADGRSDLRVVTSPPRPRRNQYTHIARPCAACSVRNPSAAAAAPQAGHMEPPPREKRARAAFFRDKEARREARRSSARRRGSWRRLHMELLPPTLLSHLLNQRTFPGSRASRSSSRGEGAAPCRRRGALQLPAPAGAQAGTRHMVGRSSRAGLALDWAVSTSDSSRVRLQNGLRLGSAGRGGFAFSGLTASAAQRRSPWAATCAKHLEKGKGLPGRT